MTQKERLKKLIEQGSGCPDGGGPFGDCTNCKYKDDDACNITRLADYLLENGVIVPPVKVGQIVYALWDIEEIGWRIKPETILAINILGSGIYVETQFDYYKIDEIGKEVFLTQEEAEKALAERQVDNE